MNKAGIYIHIPFCLRKCGYCDFYSVAGQQELIPRFIKSLIREIDYSQALAAETRFDTLFFGGGTPSLLEPHSLAAVLDALAEKFDLTAVTEISLEANPGTVTPEKLQAYRKLGINRLSLGIQSFDQDNLKFLHRIHSAADGLAAIAAARTAGFANISCDLIFGLPGQDWNLFRRDLETVCELEPEHLSCYSLTVEQGTDLYWQVFSDRIKLPGEEVVVEIYQRTREYLAERGYAKYEVSNYSRPGFECRHNLHYWNIEPYLGFGPSAHSFDGRRRWWNFSDLNLYLANMKSRLSPIKATEILTEPEITNERVGFGLRLVRGFDPIEISSELQTPLRSNIDLCRRKWPDCLEISNGRVRLTAKGFLFADAIAVDLMVT
ncbi:MAG: radical SAM family heme chaperone HemW [Candidatus Neomarinimicrobiota bacterium]